MSAEGSVVTADSRSASPERRSPAMGAVAMVLAVAALAAASWATVRHSAGTTEDFSADQRAAATAKACAAFDTVRHGADLNTNSAGTGGPDDAADTLAVAANARLSLLSGGQYLISRIDPATPPGLTTEIRNFANTLMDIGAASIAGIKTTDPQQVTRLQDAQALSITVNTQCLN